MGAHVCACAELCWPSAWDHLHPIALLSLGTHVGTPEAPGGVWDWDTPGVPGWGSSWGGSATCQPPWPQAGSPDGTGQPGCWGSTATAMFPPERAGLGEGYRGGRGACALLPASDPACPPPRGHLCDGLSTEKQQSNPGRALLGCQLPFL